MELLHNGGPFNVDTIKRGAIVIEEFCVYKNP
jgi:hypothetical protein